jgi:hypothetical protein
MRKYTSLIALIVLVSSSSALAWDGEMDGTIYNAYGSVNGNGPFRVSLTGYLTTPFCGANTPPWGYVSDSDGNYKVKVAMLLSAQARAAEVHLYLVKDALGSCQIVDMWIR